MSKLFANLDLDRRFHKQEWFCNNSRKMLRSLVTENDSSKITFMSKTHEIKQCIEINHLPAVFQSWRGNLNIWIPCKAPIITGSQYLISYMYLDFQIKLKVKFIIPFKENKIKIHLFVNNDYTLSNDKRRGMSQRNTVLSEINQAQKSNAVCSHLYKESQGSWQ